MPGPRVAVKIAAKNPNPHGACACSPHSRVQDCKPPYVIWTHSESMEVRNPHFVTCMACVKGAVTKYDKKAFEPETVTVEVLPPDYAVLQERLDEITRLMTPKINA